MEDAFHDKIAQLSHEDVGLGIQANRNGESPNVVVVTVGEGDGVDRLPSDTVKEGEARVAGELGMDAGVHEEPVAIDFDHPSAGAHIGCRVEICDLHGSESAR
jgi:hypothetical protein